MAIRSDFVMESAASLQQRLRDSEERLATAVDIAELGIWEYDSATHEGFLDARCRDVFGLTEERGYTREEVVACVHPDDREALAQAVARALDPHGRGHYEIEYRVVRPDGTERWVAVRGRVVPGRAGAHRFVGTLRDVSARRRAENLVLERERRFEALLAATAESVWVNSPDGEYLVPNPSWERLTGQTFEAARGHGWSDAIHPDDRAPTLAAWRAAVAEGRVFAFEHRVRRHDGAYRWMSVHASPVIGVDGSVLEWVGMHVDIDDRKRAIQQAHALAASEERARLALAGGQLGVWEHDIDTDAIRLDARAREHFGLDTDTLPFAEFRPRIHPDDREHVRRVMRGATDPAIRGPIEMEYRVVDGKGGVRWVSVFGTVHFALGTDGERAVSAVGTSQDVTRRKFAEEALKEADRRKDEFMATLAHELRNPLAPMRNAVRVLASAAATDQQQQWSREVVERQIATMARLLDDLLDASRITRGKLELRREPVLLWSVLGSAVETSQPLIDARRHRLHVDWPAEPIRLDADPVRLGQVISNLLNNAAKYTAPGGRIDLVARADAAQVRIEVRDTGIGLDAGALDGIFEMFVQVESSRAHAEGGLGIGLALVKGLVELHGGRVEVHSAGPGQGATFAVILPRHAADVPVAPVPGDAAVEPTARRRVLIADDNRDHADSLAMLLALEGHDVRVVYSGDAALAAATEFDPDATLLDIGMPGLNGYEVAARIRRLPRARRTLLVAITGWGQEDDRKRALAAGFDEHLTKPTNLDRVTALLRG